MNVAYSNYQTDKVNKLMHSKQKHPARGRAIIDDVILYPKMNVICCEVYNKKNIKSY